MLRRPLLLGIGAAILAAGVLAVSLSRLTEDGNTLTIVQYTTTPKTASGEQPLAGLCPWRNPGEDLKHFFPTATAYREETLILSRQRLEVDKRLGRKSTGEESALKIFRILHEQTPIGAVVPRRVRGESGVIELVLAVGADGKVVGARVQRLREPEAVAQTLQSPSWLNSFRGMTGASDWKPGRTIPDVPAASRVSAAAIVDGARTALILLDVGNGTQQGIS